MSKTAAGVRSDFGFLKCLMWFVAGSAAFVVVVATILAALTIRRPNLPATSGIVVDDLNAAASNISNTVYNRMNRKRDGKDWVRTGLSMLFSGKTDEEPVVLNLPRPQVVALSAFAENMYSVNAEPDRQARFRWSGDALAVDYELPVAKNLVIPFHAVVAPRIDNSKLTMRIDLVRAGSIVLPAKHCQKLADRALLEFEKDPDYREAIKTVSSMSWSGDGNMFTIVIPADAALKLVKLIAGF